MTVGSEALVLSPRGVTIGQDAIVAEGSMVTKNVAHFTIVGWYTCQINKNSRNIKWAKMNFIN